MIPPPFNPLSAKLSSFVDLDEDESAALDLMISQPVLRGSRTDLIREGERPSDVIVMLEGWACRYKILADGSKQIMAYLLPGDLCDSRVFILDRMDHSIGLLTKAKVAFIPKGILVETTDRHPRIARAFWWSTLVDEAVLRHWLLNVGQRGGYERVAHLFCELWDRLHPVGLRSGDQMDIPLTQEQLGDSLGVTTVHMNRLIQRLRDDGLIVMGSKSLRVLDIERLREAAEYDPTYLHLKRRTA